MRVVAFSGSSKCENSVTYTYFEYIMKNMPEHEYKVFQISREINKLEAADETFKSTMDLIKSSDCVFWVTPVQSYNVPSQLKRFVELVFQEDAVENFQGKYATSLNTSVHVMDHTAHGYRHAISEDMGMGYIPGYSAGMMDLMEAGNRKNLVSFAKGFFEAADREDPVERLHHPLNYQMEDLILPEVDPVPIPGKKIIIVADLGLSSNLDKMVDALKQILQGEVKIIDINKINMIGPCLSCLKCSYDGTCVYKGKDDVHDAYKEINAADVVIMAMCIKDRWYSSRFKQFIDRSFFQNHKPRYKGKQVAYLVSGPLGELPYLRETLENAPQINLGGLAGIVTDESGARTTTYLHQLAKNIGWRLKEGYIEPQKFFGVGAHLIFRDLIYSNPTMVADYKLFKESGYFDYPQNEIKTRIYNVALRQALRFKSFRENVYADMPSLVVKPYKEIVEKA